MDFIPLDYISYLVEPFGTPTQLLSSRLEELLEECNRCNRARIDDRRISFLRGQSSRAACSDVLLQVRGKRFPPESRKCRETTSILIFGSYCQLDHTVVQIIALQLSRPLGHNSAPI
jgi:hypothetical protein